MDEVEVPTPDDTWLIIRMPDQTYAWNLGQIDDAGRETAIMAARAAVGFPADDLWPRQLDQYSVSLSFGRPHGDLMGAAVQGSVEQLDALPAEKLDAYRAEYAASVRKALVAAAVATLADMDPGALAEVLAHPSVQATKGA